MAFWEASFGGSSGGSYRLRQSVDILGQETGNNRTLIRYNAYIDKVAGTGFWNLSTTSGATNINGYVPGRSWASYDFRAYTRKYIAQNEDYWIYHDGAGDANPYFAVSWNLNNGSSLTTASTGGNFAMPHINRYATITSVVLNNVTDEKIQVNWNSDVNVDYVSWWSSMIDGGAHHDIPVSGTGTFIVYPANLRSGTVYDFKVAVRHADSDLWTESGVYYTTTLPQNGFFLMDAGTGF